MIQRLVGVVVVALLLLRLLLVLLLLRLVVVVAACLFCGLCVCLWSVGMRFWIAWWGPVDRRFCKASLRHVEIHNSFTHAHYKYNYSQAKPRQPGSTRYRVLPAPQSLVPAFRVILVHRHPLVHPSSLLLAHLRSWTTLRASLHRAFQLPRTTLGALTSPLAPCHPYFPHALSSRSSPPYLPSFPPPPSPYLGATARRFTLIGTASSEVQE